MATTFFDMNKNLWENYLPVQDDKEKFEELPVLKLIYCHGENGTPLIEVVAHFAGHDCDCSTCYDNIGEALEAIRDDYDMMNSFLCRFPYEFCYELCELTQKADLLVEKAELVNEE